MAHVECALIRNTDSLHYTHSVVVVGCVMRRECLFDRLPVELLHTLFTYFLAHETLFSFSDVSDYVSSTLLTYSTHRMNFNATLSPIDLIYSGIRPEQVISLTFSNDIHIVEVFFTRFRIEEFTRLSSLTLMQSHFQQLRSTIGNLHKLEGLHSLSFDTAKVRCQYDARNIDCKHRFLDEDIISWNFRMENSLRRAHLQSNDLRFRQNVHLPRLVHLKITQCPADHLCTVLRQAPRLRSLEVCVSPNTYYNDFNLQSNQLLRLVLKVEGKYRVTNLRNIDHVQRTQ